MSAITVARVGAKTAVGLNAQQTGFLLRAGFPAMAEAPLANAAGEAITMAFVPTIDGRLVGAERLAALARAPLEEAVAPVRDVAAEVYVAIDEGCVEGPLSIALLEALVKRVTPAAKVAVEARGEAGPGAFLPAAIRALETRRVDAVVIGGVHSDHDPRAIAALEASGRLFSRDNLDARIPGEAAAFFLLMRTADAARLKLTSIAHVIGVGTGRERARPDNDELAYEATGLTAAVRQATEPLAADGRTVGWILTDLTGEMRRQYEWQSVFVRAQKVLGKPYLIESPAQRIGYLGAAATPLFVAMAATAWKHGYAPSPIALAMAGNDGGDRVAVVLGKQ
ncbi:beta-ketoacyl synthase N-terminal-like domain-containing protein [Sorangium sp. So ce1182]|uniref:beta-ketoacyl synthase N-terminal-like domain-containing protein n=1 Tax=Sorangium sp. So ce1182 TaxID=3133334 RepID=UPI003F635585